MRALTVTGWGGVATAAVLVACGGSASPRPASATSGLDAAGYVSVAGRLQVHLDRLWNEHLGRYEPPGLSGTVTEVNANLLLVHAVAARLGEHGPVRDDRRARSIARFLTGPRAWTEHPLPDSLPWITGPGWRAAPNNPNQHLVFSAEAAEGLAEAYRARRELGLDATTVAAIRDQVARTAASPDFRWPALRLNQFNWHIALFAADALVNGATRTLADELERHLARFLGGVPGGEEPARSLGPGLHFRYLPHRPASHPANLDSAEYANIVLGFSRHYNLARASGMLAPAQLGQLRAWVRRALAGYWTHAGALNWDTGLGFGRWHQSKKVPLAQAALLGIAATPELQTTPEWGAWAKQMLDRGLQAYADEADRRGRIPPAVAFGLDVVRQSRANAYLAASRSAANAMRALTAGLASAPAAEPPALFAYDAETGRLAVTTPSYSTGIVAVNRGAFPYGGLDLARLLDGRGRVVASLGGVAPATFGLQGGGLRTQYGRRTGRSPLRLTRGPAAAGPFSDLRVRGTVRRGGRHATSAYRFTADAIEGRWTLSHGRARVTFPTWGRGTRITVAGRRVTARGRPLAGVGTIDLGGYRVTPLTHPRGARLRLLTTRPTPSNPNPGPTLAVDVPGRAFAARIVVE